MGPFDIFLLVLAALIALAALMWGAWENGWRHGFNEADRILWPTVKLAVDALQRERPTPPSTEQV